MYTFTGVQVTDKEYRMLVALRNSGKCPFCLNNYSRKYGNMTKHIRACEARKKLVQR